MLKVPPLTGNPNRPGLQF